MQRPLKLGLTLGGIAVVAAGTTVGVTSRAAAAGPPTATPIKHLVVIFQENISFDHYFGTYPNATNPAGEPAFQAAAGTPTVNNLQSAGLLTNNPNVSNPQRLDRSEQVTCDENHDYTAEQLAMDRGVADAFVQNTGSLTRIACDTSAGTMPPPGVSPTDYAVLDYYDGNTVAGLWNYAQHFAMSDNSFSTTYGPSTPGALNVISGQTYGVQCSQNSGDYSSIAGGDPNAYPSTTPACPGGGNFKVGGSLGNVPGTSTMISDADAYYDVCSSTSSTAAMGGPNIGAELSTAGITWGWFEGGFQNEGYVPGQPSTSTVATAGCTAKHYNVLAGPSLDGQPCTSGTGCQADYSAHHEPFQYYASTSNPMHTAPSSVATIGTNGDGANHQYDLADFWAAVHSGHMPAVSYLKAPRFEDGHPHNSDPQDEQQFLASTINKLEKTSDWSSTAVVIAYDDSDGWYDHVLAPVVMQSQTPTAPPSGDVALDQLTGVGQCGSSANRVPQSTTGAPEAARCGYGMRQPLLVISPFSRQNFVDHSTTDQSSVVRFIEDNWLQGARLGNGAADAFAGTLDNMFDFGSDGKQAKPLFLNPVTGQPDQNNQ